MCLCVCSWCCISSGIAVVSAGWREQGHSWFIRCREQLAERRRFSAEQLNSRRAKQTLLFFFQIKDKRWSQNAFREAGIRRLRMKTRRVGGAAAAAAEKCACCSSDWGRIIPWLLQFGRRRVMQPRHTGALLGLLQEIAAFQELGAAAGRGGSCSHTAALQQERLVAGGGSGTWWDLRAAAAQGFNGICCSGLLQ